MPAERARRHSNACQAFLRRAVELDLLATDVWRFAVKARSGGLIERAVELEHASRWAQVAAIECRARSNFNPPYPRFG